MVGLGGSAGHRADDRIIVRTVPPVQPVLQLLGADVDGHQKFVTGFYTCEAGKPRGRDGMPVWASGERQLYVSAHGHWTFARDAASVSNGNGDVFSVEVHG